MLRHYSPLSSPSPPKNNQRDLLKTKIKSCSSLLRPLQWFSITYYSPNFKFEFCLLHFVSCFLLSSSVHLRCAGSFTSAVLSACCNLFLNRVLANSFPSFKSFLSSPLRRAVFRWPIWNIFSSSLYPYFIFLYIYHCLIVFFVNYILSVLLWEKRKHFENCNSIYYCWMNEQTNYKMKYLLPLQ